MNKKLVLALSITIFSIPFFFAKEASAKECEVGSPCPCGYYYKKGGFTTHGTPGGKSMSGGYCVQLGHMGNMRP